MNTLKQMGIQQWRLKNSRAEAPASEVGAPQNTSAEPKAELAVEQDLNGAVSLVLADNPADSPAKSPADQNQSQLASKPVAAAQIFPQAQPAPAEEVVVAEQDQSSHSELQRLDWQGLQALIDSNDNCPSCGSQNSLLGSGDANANWMFVVDAPTSREVSEQTLFVGRAGDLFDAMLRALGLKRTDVYTSSVFKCAPTEDLSATPQCNELVHRQIELVDPQVIVTFGEFAAQAVIKANENLELLRLNQQRCVRTAVTIVPTYSPVQMLNDLSLKALVWEDLKKAMAIVGS